MYTENGTNGKRKFVFHSPKTRNDNRLLFQQMCPSMPKKLIHMYSEECTRGKNQEVTMSRRGELREKKLQKM